MPCGPAQAGAEGQLEEVRARPLGGISAVLEGRAILIDKTLTTAKSLYSTIDASATGAMRAVGIGSDQARIKPSSDGILRSTFTRLVFLDGRFSPHFQQVDDRTGYARARVRTRTV